MTGGTSASKKYQYLAIAVEQLWAQYEKRVVRDGLLHLAAPVQNGTLHGYQSAGVKGRSIGMDHFVADDSDQEDRDVWNGALGVSTTGGSRGSRAVVVASDHGRNHGHHHGGSTSSRAGTAAARSGSQEISRAALVSIELGLEILEDSFKKRLRYTVRSLDKFARRHRMQDLESTVLQALRTVPAGHSTSSIAGLSPAVVTHDTLLSPFSGMVHQTPSSFLHVETSQIQSNGRSHGHHSSHDRRPEPAPSEGSSSSSSKLLLAPLSPTSSSLMAAASHSGYGEVRHADLKARRSADLDIAAAASKVATPMSSHRPSPKGTMPTGIMDALVSGVAHQPHPPPPSGSPEARIVQLEQAEAAAQARAAQLEEQCRFLQSQLNHGAGGIADEELARSVLNAGSEPSASSGQSVFHPDPQHAMMRQLCSDQARVDEVIRLASVLLSSGVLVVNQRRPPVVKSTLLIRLAERCYHASLRDTLQLWWRRAALRRSMEEAGKLPKVVPEAAKKESKAMQRSGFDEVSSAGFLEYCTSLSASLSKGHERVKDEIFTFMEMQKEALQDQGVATSNFAPFEPDGSTDRIVIEMTIERKENDFEVSYKSRHSCLLLPQEHVIHTPTKPRGADGGVWQDPQAAANSLQHAASGPSLAEHKALLEECTTLRAEMAEVAGVKAQSHNPEQAQLEARLAEHEVKFATLSKDCDNLRSELRAAEAKARQQELAAQKAVAEASDAREARAASDETAAAAAAAHAAREAALAAANASVPAAHQAKHADTGTKATAPSNTQNISSEEDEDEDSLYIPMAAAARPPRAGATQDSLGGSAPAAHSSVPVRSSASIADGIIQDTAGAGATRTGVGHSSMASGGISGLGISALAAAYEESQEQEGKADDPSSLSVLDQIGANGSSDDDASIDEEDASDDDDLLKGLGM